MSYVVVVSSELNHPALPGLSIFQRDLVEAASQTGVACELLAPAKVFILRVKASMIYRLFARVSLAPSNSLLSLPGFLLRGLIAYRGVVKRREGHPLIIHAHNSLHAGALALLVCRTYGIPFIVTEHNQKIFYGWLKLKLVNLIYKHARTITTVSESTKDIITKLTIAPEVRVIPNIIGSDFFAPVVSRARSNEIVVVGNFDVNKNQMFALRVVSELARHSSQEFSARFIGDGERLSECIDYASSSGLRMVHFLGYCTREVVRECMLQAKVLLNVSRSETFGVVNVEAGLCGCVVISNDNGGARDSTVREVSTIFANEDPKSVAMLVSEWFSKDLDHEEISTLYRKAFMRERIVSEYYGDFLREPDCVS